MDMKKVYSETLQFRGSHYDFGYEQGLKLQNSPILENRKKIFGPKKNRRYIIDVETYRAVIHEFMPLMWDELEGLRDALKMSWEDVVQEFGGYYLEYGRSGCSIFTGNNYMIRNYDNAPETYEGRYILYQPTDGGYATIGPTMQITGRMDGLNEKGLAIGYNFVNRKKGEDGFICNMIGRIVLENAASNQEAIDLLKAIPHRYSFNYVLLDKSGQSIVVEASPRNVEVHESNFCANHFQILNEENRYQMVDSERRVRLMAEQQSSINEPYEAFKLLNDSSKEIFSSKYGAWAGTLHTAAYLPQDLKVWFSLGGDQMPVIFDFGKWLKGENTLIKRINGKIDSKHGFVNMGILEL